MNKEIDSAMELESLKNKAYELRRDMAFKHGIPEKNLYALCDIYRIIGRLEVKL
jgi:hypothetical protein